MSAEAPDRIGPYTVIARLDEKGEQPVYKVEDGAGRTLAVKLYPWGEGEEMLRYRRDALEKAVSLRHPALVRYEQIGEHDGRVFAAMELFPGATLRKSLQILPMGLQRALRIIRQVAEGLAYLHRQGMVYRCLDPSRVLVSDTGDKAKLIEPAMCPDAAPGSIAATATMQVASMARYVAPELQRAAAAAPDARTDIYSFGVLAYEALTGKIPSGRFRLPSQEKDEVPPELDEVVLRCLREDPAARYRTADELVPAIDRVQRSLPGGLGSHFESLTSTTRGLLGSEAGARRGWLWLLLTLLGVIAVAVAIVLLRT